MSLLTVDTCFSLFLLFKGSLHVSINYTMSLSLTESLLVPGFEGRVSLTVGREISISSSESMVAFDLIRVERLGYERKVLIRDR